MSEAGSIARSPVLGEAALQQAFAELCGGTTAQPARVAGAEPKPAPKTVAQALGEIAWLMTQSPRHKVMTLGDLEWLVMPAILLRQFRIFYSGSRPVGVALWAMADDLVAKRIDAGERRLTAAEWKSGATLRIVELVAPFGKELEMRKQIEELAGAAAPEQVSTSS
jgi:cytolysin-activating lysine-acyltransferase